MTKTIKLFDEEQAQLHLETLFGWLLTDELPESEVYVAFAHGEWDEVTERTRDGSWEEAQFDLGMGYDPMLLWIGKWAHRRHELYVNYHPRLVKNRRKDGARGHGRTLWLDGDDRMGNDVPKRWRAANGWAVASGTPGHFHLGLTLGGEMAVGDRETHGTVENTNLRLAEVLGGDAKWSNEALLRVAGTRNYKRGGDGLPVEWVYKPEDKEAGLDEITRLLNSAPAKPAGVGGRKSRGKSRAPLGDDRVDESRSAAAYKYIKDLLLIGKTDDEIVDMILAHEEIKGHYRNKSHAKEDVLRVRSKRDKHEASVSGRPPLDCTNFADAFDELSKIVGTGPLTGVYLRSDMLVHCPRIGEDGYSPPVDVRAGDGPAQVRPVSPTKLQTLVQQRMWPYVEFTDGRGGVEESHTILPNPVAILTVDAAPDLEHLPLVRTTTHTPILSASGDIISKPGYTAAAYALYLPDPGLVVNEPPPVMSPDLVSNACSFLEWVIQDFPFEKPEHKANYLTYLLTPVLKLMLPPPYPMFLFNAHQPGSGKTLLTQVGRAVHGGVHRPEMPQDDNELRKQISGILSTTTAPLVIWDNLDKMVRSPIIAGLLTEPEWNDRLLGTNKDIRAINDRIWAGTGNNISIGGDMARRVMYVSLDPRMERPQERTGFKVKGLETWARTNRGGIIASLLVLARAWVEKGCQKTQIRSDSYDLWSGSMTHVLEPFQHGELSEAFRDQDTEGEVKLSDSDAELSVFLEALLRAFGGDPFRTPQVASAMMAGILQSDCLPESVAAVVLRGGSTARSVGKFLSKCEKRAAGGLRVSSMDGGRGGTLWQIEKL